MIAFRSIQEEDLPLIESWFYQDHVKRWFEIPQLTIGISDWLYEIRNRHTEFSWITYFIVTWKKHPIGLCQFYHCQDSNENSFGSLNLNRLCGIDYLIGEPLYLNRGIGKELVSLLIDKIFCDTNAHRVTASVDSSNLISQKTLIANGFQLLSIEKGYNRYILEKSDYLQQQR